MTVATGPQFAVGSLVSARGREWVVLPDSTDDFLVVRPIAGTEDDVAGLLVDVEHPQPARFPPPTVNDLGDQVSATLLRTALRIGFRSSAGPFRSLGSLAVEPRPYQLVPLLLAMRQDVVRLLIADDVGIGKTIEAGLVAAELLATGDARGLTVLCSPALAEQWQEELRTKFAIDAELVLPSTVTRLERSLIGAESIFERFPHTVVSTDFIKSPRRRSEFLRTCSDLVIVDEAHTCVADEAGVGRRSRQQRYDLVHDLADDPRRHLLLVTATPHSGKESTFRTLIGLLDPDLAALDLEQRQGRERLARHFVQRRRRDIRRFLDEETPFPRDRLTREAPYDLTADYRALFERVLGYARATVRDTSGSAVHQRVRWWSALALLRALASSPRAASQTLRTRAAGVAAASLDEADELGRAVVLDEADEEALEAIDTTPGADPDSGEALTEPRRQLLALARQAEQLEHRGDAKLAEGIRVVEQLLADGFNPIVFCRFIDTAEYVGEHLARALGATASVEVVTGVLPPEERMRRVDELTRREGQHVLVATDCLSEGINLQDGFQAVVHYDLAWNPTRHEQREGRVDRFGQRAPEVRAVTIYGRDNSVDGIVLEVLLRKHEAIRRATGVSVPVPADSSAVLEAVLEGLLLRNRDPEQLALDIGESKREALHAQWDSAAARESQAVTKFAQTGIHPEEVARELAEARAALGTHAEVEDLVVQTFSALGATLSSTGDGFLATTQSLPPALRTSLPPAHVEPLPFHHDLPAPRGHAVLHRTDPHVGAVAQFVLDAALDPQLPGRMRPARRCGVIRTRAVDSRTTLLLVRYRFHLRLPGRAEERALVAEDAAMLAFRGSGETLTWLPDDQVRQLRSASADANVPPDQARDFAERALAAVDALAPQIDRFGDTVGERLRESHARVRSAAGQARRGLAVSAQKPADILGVYVYLPVPAARGL